MSSVGSDREGRGVVEYTDRPWTALYPPEVLSGSGLGEASMLDLWDETVRHHVDRPWIRYFDATLTVGQVEAMSDAIAAALVDGGLTPGDRVALYLQNDPQWPVVLLAVWKAGATAVAINPMLRERELEHHLVDSGATVLVCLESLYRTVVAHRRGTGPLERIITTHPTDLVDVGSLPPAYTAMIGDKSPPSDTEDLVDLLERFPHPTSPPRRPTPDDVAVLTYTSGTTGTPKGAMITHATLAYNAQMASRWFGLSDGDVSLGVAPMFHITGIVVQMGVCMSSGTPLVLFHRFDADQCLDMIERWRPTFTIAAITVFTALMDRPDFARRDLSSLTKISTGGAPVSPVIVERFESMTGVYIQNTYGLTEATAPATLTPPHARSPVDPVSGALSVGIPVPGAQVSMVDPTTREPVPMGDRGEIVIAGPMVVPGYWQQPEESRMAIPDGRLHTGDIGFMDDAGWVFIVDRSKDQINAGGYKIWPREVEDVLYQHPAVREAAVVGKPDDYRGESVKAYVSLNAGQQVSPEDLIAFCRQHMAAYKYPREVEVIDELPKTATGKFLRRELRGRALHDPRDPG